LGPVAGGVLQSAGLPMNVELRKEYRFEAAHFLPKVPAGHKCARMHGHSYRVELALVGPVDPATGWLIDFSAIDELWEPIFRTFDHHVLNEVPGLENSTCENMAIYVWQALRPTLPGLAAVTIWETLDGCCTYRGT
jgi:6-pyruvoyltetrahydropterin/6-carboxytetrahydropterin synthase